MSWQLNEHAFECVGEVVKSAGELNVQPTTLPGGGRIVDCGIAAPGGLEAGLALVRTCMSGLGNCEIVTAELGGRMWPHIQVRTDVPVAACLLSQYAGWKLQVDRFFAMGSGPMRAAANTEELFTDLDYSESPPHVVGVLESGKQPNDDVVRLIAEKTNVDPESVVLLVAPTASLAGTLQVVARSVETALHKLHELEFDLTRIRAGWGVAPLPPVAGDDMTAIGWTNDAVLYGARVVLWVTGDDDSLSDVGARVPSSSSSQFGQPFLEIFQAAGRDFYQIDPMLFSPAEVVLQNVETGTVHTFGRTDSEVLRSSFRLR